LRAAVNRTVLRVERVRWWRKHRLNRFFAAVALAAAGLHEGTTSGADDQTACLAQPLVSGVSPLNLGPFPAQTTAVVDVQVANADRGTCNPRLLLLLPGAAPPGFAVFAAPTSAVVAPGETARFDVSVTATTAASPGGYTVPFQVLDVATGERVAGAVDYTLLPPAGCQVMPDRELMVRDLSVVEDPLRTSFDPASTDPRAGVWTFARLMADMAPDGTPAGAFAEAFFGTWLDDQPVGGFTIPARRAIRPFVLNAWPRDGRGRLDLARAPLRLLAIVNRIDVRDLAAGRAGEGRFVFGVLDPAGRPAPFTLIVEYALPGATEADVLSWARAWHALGALPFPSEAYNAALQRITRRFSARGARPGAPNGSALDAIRTDEIALAPAWELRQFRLSKTGAALEPAPVDLTPDGSLDGSPQLADFVDASAAAIRGGSYAVPSSFEGAPFQGAASINALTAWNAPGIVDGEARHLFSLNTCNGCHGAAETGTEFLHVFPRPSGVPAALSGFLLGLAVPDPVDGELRTFNDLGRRKADLEGLVCTCRGDAAYGGRVTH
jgi:hypothetical protein